MTASFYLAFAVLWLLVLFNSLVIIGLVRERNAGPAAATRAVDNADYHPEYLTGQDLPAFTGRDVLGNEFDSRDLRGHATALLFVSPECSTCSVTLDELGTLNNRMDGNVVVVCRSDADRCRELTAEYALDVPVVLDEDQVLSDLLGVTLTPTAILVDEHGVIGSYGHPMSAEAFEEQLAGDSNRSDGLHVSLNEAPVAANVVPAPTNGAHRGAIGGAGGGGSPTAARPTTDDQGGRT